MSGGEEAGLVWERGKWYVWKLYPMLILACERPDHDCGRGIYLSIRCLEFNLALLRWSCEERIKRTLGRHSLQHSGGNNLGLSNKHGHELS